MGRIDLIRLPWDILLEIIAGYLDLEDVFMVLAAHPLLRLLGESKSLWIMLLGCERQTRPLKCSEYQDLSDLDARSLKHIALHAVRRDSNLAHDKPITVGPAVAIDMTPHTTESSDDCDLRYVAHAYGTSLYIFRHSRGVLAFDLESKTASPMYRLPVDWNVKHSHLSPDPSDSSCFRLVMLVKFYDTYPKKLFKLVVLSMTNSDGTLALQETALIDLQRTKNEEVYESFLDVFSHRDVVGTIRVRAHGDEDSRTALNASIVMHGYNVRGGPPARLEHGIHETIDGYQAFVERGKAFGLCSTKKPDIGLSLIPFDGQLPFYDHAAVEVAGNAKQNGSPSRSHKCWTPSDDFSIGPEDDIPSILADEVGLYSTRFKTTLVSHHWNVLNTEHRVHTVSVFDKIDDTTFQGARAIVTVPRPHVSSGQIVGWGPRGCLIGWRTSEGSNISFTLLNVCKDWRSSKMFDRYLEVPSEVNTAIEENGGYRLKDLIWDEHRAVVVLVMRTGTVWTVPYA